MDEHPCMCTYLHACIQMKETETYISQLEGENKVPTGKELVR